MSNIWQEFIKEEQQKEYFQALESFLAFEKSQGKVIYPKEELRFSAFELCSFEDTKVVIIGQDPYHGENQAHGLAFSIPSTQKKFPPSLQNIFKELSSDMGCHIPRSGNLTAWAKQGVLLINAVLSVEASCANSHKDKGWEIFSDSVIKKLSDEREGVIFVLWGGYAQKKEKLIDAKRHHIIKTAHPSPLSAYRGFFGSKVFSRINTLLKEEGIEEIKWCLEERLF